MRVPGKNTPLVSLPEGGDGGRKYGLDLGSPGFRAGYNGMFSGPNRFYEPLAKGFEDVARATSMIAKDMLMREDHAKVNEALTRFTEGELTPFLYGENGEFTKQGEQALGGTNRVADFFKNTPNRYTEGLSKNALAAFGEQINSRKMAVLSSTAQHEAKERNAWEIGTMQAAAQSDADFALHNHGDERIYHEYENRALQTWDALADKKGFSPEQKKLFLQQQASSMQVGRIARFSAGGDHVQAFNEMKYGNMTADDKFKAQKEVGTAFFADMMKQGRLNPKATSEYFSAKGWKLVEVKNLPPQHVQALVAEGEKQGLAPEVIKILPRVMAAESGGNPDAVSPAGAVGLMQLMPEAAKEMGVTDRRDPAQNIKGGVGYLAKKIKEFDGDVALGLMAYNWGAANVRAWLATGKGKDGRPLREETKAYVAKTFGVDVVATYRPTEPDSVEDLLTPSQKAEIVKVNNVALADTFSEDLYQQVTSGQISEAQAREQIANISDLDVRKATRQGFTEWMQITRIQEEEDKLNAGERAYDDINKITNSTDKSEAEILGELYNLRREADLAKHTGKASEKVYNKAYFNAVNEIYSNLISTKGISKASDPMAFIEAQDAIIYGKVTDARELKAMYPTLAYQDVERLASVLGKSQTVNLTEVNNLYSLYAGLESGQAVTPEEKTEHAARKAALAQNIIDSARETNRGNDPEWLRAKVAQFFVAGEKRGVLFDSDVTSGAAALEGTDFYPKISEAEHARIKAEFDLKPELQAEYMAKHDSLNYAIRARAWDKMQVGLGTREPERPLDVPEDAVWDKDKMGWIGKNPHTGRPGFRAWTGSK